jgi:hypothetical protein
LIQKAYQPLNVAVPTATVRNFFHKSKDVTISAAARFAVNARLRGIGQMTELSIDTKNRRILARLELIGEAEPIEIEIVRYTLRTKENVTTLTIEEATASRPWIATAFQEFVIGETLTIPKKAAAILKLLT